MERGEAKKGTGQMYLYGEDHAVKDILDREAQLWQMYYTEDGMRDLFIEFPYYTAEYLNIWMKEENDDILDEVWADMEGTAYGSEIVKEFYQKIKAECPETVFHGTDIGHQYDTTGERYLMHLRENGEEDSENYKLAEENIAQGKKFYEAQDFVYRENAMTENFIREYEKLKDADLMGIYGAAHMRIEEMLWDDQVPSMSNQINSRFEGKVHVEDLNFYEKAQEALRRETVEAGGNTYDAQYYGKTDISAEYFPVYQEIEFWRLENSYADFQECETTGEQIACNKFPMAVKKGQVFVLDYIRTDGSVIRRYCRTDGKTENGVQMAEILDEGDFCKKD